MPFSITVHHGPYLLVVGSGRAQLCDVLGLVELVSIISRKQSYRRVLLDLMAVEINFSVSDHITLGTYTAGALVHLQKVASAVNAEYRTGDSERAAKSIGLNIRTFTNLADATAWLESS